MFTFFTNPLLCLKQDDFKITLRGERKVVKIVQKLVWFKKSLFGLRYWPSHKISQFFVIEFVPSAVLSQTNYFEQKGILRRL